MREIIATIQGWKVDQATMGRLERIREELARRLLDDIRQLLHQHPADSIIDALRRLQPERDPWQTLIELVDYLELIRVVSNV